MDALKLLLRGTSRQKARPGLEYAKSRLPSSGAEARPQPLKATTINSVDGTSGRTSKKRKRDSPEDAKDIKTGGSVGSTGQADVDLDEEERRRILKKHKLKVMLLDQSHGGSSKDKSNARLSNGKKHKRNAIHPRPLQTFGELQTRYHVSKRLMGSLKKQGFYTPTEVQMAALPILLGDESDSGLDTSGVKSGDKLQPDLLTIAPTGSGKTLAFLIPVIQRLMDLQHTGPSENDDKSRFVKAIVLAPTHELVDQIVIEGKKLCAGTGIKVSAAQKGSHIAQEAVSAPSDKQAVIKTDIVVSTPMTIVNELHQSAEEAASLGSVLHLVLDEADILLDPLFRDQTLAIWTACKHQDLRVSLWSATIGASIETLAQEFIASRRQRLGLKTTRHLFRLIVGLKDSSLPTIAHRLTYAATEHGKLLALRELLHPSTAAPEGSLALRPPFLVFTQTIQRAKALHSELLYDIPAEAGGSTRIAVLHSDLSEAARSNVMAGFRKGEIWVIITTDLLSRGVDFRGVNGVVNYDIPSTGASYVHRAGRTGRAGREGGIAVTLYTKEDIPYVRNIANVIAASEKAHGTTAGQTEPALQKWLLDSLPKVSKQAKQELKKRGVAARRTTQQGEDKSREERMARISTRSGYARRLDSKRRGAKRRPGGHDGDEDEWQGIGD